MRTVRVTLDLDLPNVHNLGIDALRLQIIIMHWGHALIGTLI